MSKAKIDEKQVLKGARLPVEGLDWGDDFKFQWSDPITDHNGTLQVSRLLGLAVVAMKLQPKTKRTFSFPTGAIAVVLRGKLIVAVPASTPGHASGFPTRLLASREMVHIEKQVPVNFGSYDLETVFILFQPGGMESEVLTQ